MKKNHKEVSGFNSNYSGKPKPKQKIQEKQQPNTLGLTKKIVEKDQRWREQPWCGMAPATRRSNEASEGGLWP